MANNFKNQNTSNNYQPVRTVVSTQLPSNRQMNLVEQDAIELGMNASNGRYKNTVVHFQSQLKFKKLTFFDVMNEVIKPTILTMTGEPYEFKLLPEQIRLINLCHEASARQNSFQFQIRIGKIEDDGTLLITDSLPPGLDIKFSYVPHLFPSYDTLPPSIEATQPINCTDLLIFDETVMNIFFVKWTPDQNNYALTLCLVKQLTVDFLIKQLQEKEGRSSEDTRKDIIRMLADQDLVICKQPYNFSLLCPLSKKRIKIPAKSIHCDHLKCFDARIFLLMNEQRPIWKCPICDTSCLYDDIQIDNFFVGIVTSPELDDDCTDIELISDGSWIVNKNNKTKVINVTSDAEEEPMNLDEDKCIIN